MTRHSWQTLKDTIFHCVLGLRWPRFPSHYVVPRLSVIMAACTSSVVNQPRRSSTPLTSTTFFQIPLSILPEAGFKDQVAPVYVTVIKCQLALSNANCHYSFIF